MRKVLIKNENLPALLGAALGATVLALLMAIHFGNPTQSTMWHRTFFDVLHVPVFGVIAICLFVITGLSARLRLLQRLTICAIIVFVLSGISEAAQVIGPRDASLRDLIADWLGAAGCLCLATAFTGKELARGQRLVAASAGITILLVAMAPLISISIAYAERNLQHPVLIDFDSRYNYRFVHTNNASLQIITNKFGTDSTARVVLGDGRWPGLIIHDIWPDWTGYRELVIELKTPVEQRLTINVSIHDHQHDRSSQAYSDRYNSTIDSSGGRVTLRLPLDTIANAPKNRRLNLTEVHGISLFGSRNDAGKEFSLSAIRLE